MLKCTILVPARLGVLLQKWCSMWRVRQFAVAIAICDNPYECLFNTVQFAHVTHLHITHTVLHLCILSVHYSGLCLLSFSPESNFL